ncbi:hypothetical protein O0I10_012499 [Lichtheimia ornata]|uniref:Heterokaryon incompatibility domain-containing protein n=1 Tax=Lichtheimia ornata TaxID=688661 RepID=A0AAD7URN5_9FUNG|nr:uncharacterized protein O0I10_012499 [Lichtheimia ornata]KAJ8651928.1 hypothetical protein O0I10_012499 [Lichtheimia ornata]
MSKHHEGIRQLCQNQDFRLLHVTRHKNKYKMRLVRPCIHKGHQQRVLEEGYYALSHLWGNAKDYPYWQVDDFISDKEGGGRRKVDPVPMRPEKRDTLIALLKKHVNSYWWIDVLCARVDTPLMIMGSIYRYCKSCVALIDMADPFSMHRLEALSGALSKASGGYYYANRLLHRRPNITSKQVERLVFSNILSLHGIERNFGKELNVVLQVIQSQWFTRVWTAQEFLLPKQIIIMPEQRASAPTRYRMDFALLEKITERLDTIYRVVDRIPLLAKSTQHLALTRHVGSMHVLCGRSHQHEGVLDIYNNHRSRVLPRLRNVFEALASSSRVCAVSVDYVYGVIGMLELDVPRLDHPQDVWKAFLSELRRLLAHLTEQDQGCMWAKVVKDETFDLANAENLGHVYTGLVKFSRRRNRKSKRGSQPVSKDSNVS